MLNNLDPHGISLTGQSETAVVTVMREADGKVVLVGLASLNTHNEKETNDFIISYFRNFATNQVYYRMKHYLVHENNFGGGLMANWFINRATAGLPTIMTYHPNPNKDGMALFKRLKTEAVMDLITMMDEDRVYVAEKLISSKMNDTAGLVESLFKQLGCFRKVWSGNSWTYSGKMVNQPGFFSFFFFFSFRFFPFFSFRFSFFLLFPYFFPFFSFHLVSWFLF